MNKLYFGDNLGILKREIENNSVDLIYLDPPFQSGRNYNIIFQPTSQKIKGATAQVEAFKDTWKWGNEAEQEYRGLINGTITKEEPPQKLVELMKAMRNYLGECSMMAYLSMMAPRLLELKRVLKDTGSIYLHCDPTASHYLKLLMDAVFRVENFRNEIVWAYRTGGASKRNWSHKHDIILFYSKSDNYIFNIQKEKAYTKSKSRKPGIVNYGAGTAEFFKDEIGVYNLVIARDVWEIPYINSQAKERLGYPTQKPEALLERIIRASSNEEDLVLDPFCGCGTATAVAQRLNRKWIGIDISYLAIDIIVKRLQRSGFKEGKDFVVKGIPADIYSAKKLAQEDPFNFQYWAVTRIPGGRPNSKKSGDQGVDGFVNFIDSSKASKIGTGIIQVKGTKHVTPGMVRDLKGTIKSQNVDFGILITLIPPTQGMIKEAIKEGYFIYRSMKIPRIQILSVDKLFQDPIPVKLPMGNLITTKAHSAEKVKGSSTSLPSLGKEENTSQDN